MCLTFMLRKFYFSSSSVVSRAFSVLCARYARFNVRPSSSSFRLPLCRICFLFAASIAELARGEKSRTQSLTHSVTHPAYLIYRKPKLSLRKSHNISSSSSSSSLRNIFFIRSDVRRTKDDKAIPQDSHKALNSTNAHSPEWIDRQRQRQRQKLVHHGMRTSFLRLSVF